MATAYYAKYTPGHHGARDRIGGLPSHLPPEYPSCAHCGELLTFLMQIYVDDKDLFDNAWLALHLYECDDCGEQKLLALQKDARQNVDREGVPLFQLDWELNNVGVPYSRVEWGEYIAWQDITCLRREDPDPTDDIEQFWNGTEPKEEFAHLFEDKLGGCFPWCDEGGVPAKQLGAIGQFCVLRHTTYLFNDPEQGLHFCYY